MTICHCCPNIKSDMQPSHLLAKVGIYGGVRMGSHTCHDQVYLFSAFLGQLIFRRVTVMFFWEFILIGAPIFFPI